jgi:hypothetical protein
VSARQIILGPDAPELASGPVVEDLGPDSTPDLAPTFAFIDGDRTGAFVFRLFVMRAERRSQKVAAGASLARALAANLRGDYLSLFSEANSSQATATWRLRFATQEYAAQTASYLNLLAPVPLDTPANGPLWHAFQIGRDVVVAAFPLTSAVLAGAWKAPPVPAVVPATAGAIRPVICPHPAGAPLFQAAGD